MSTTETARAQWRARRQTGIGGSEAAAALGESPFKSPWDLWLEKTGTVAPPDLSDKLYVRLGQVMERGVGEIYAEHTGRIVSFWNQTQVQGWPGCPHLFCTPDALQDEPTGAMEGRGVLSIKTTDERFLKQWESEGIPLHYQIQAQHELACLGLEWGTVAVAFGRRTLRSYDFTRNDRFIAAMQAKLTEFWQSVQTRTPPTIDWSEGCSRALFALHPEDSGATIYLPPESADWDKSRIEALARIDADQRIADEAENRIKAAIGDGTFGVLPDGTTYSWKRQERAGYVVKPVSFRKLWRHKKKHR